MDDPVERAIERANERVTEATERRATQADVEAALGRAREALEALAQTSAELREGSFPVFASGVTHRGPYKNGPGEVNVPINMGGMTVNPGDIIVGDADGLVAIPQEHAEHILKSAQAILVKETKNIKEIEAGTVDRSWVDKALKEKGYKY